jgi:glutathione S-transferase
MRFHTTKELEMKLHHNSASPYVRKVLVVARECGLIEHLEIVSLALTPVNPNDALNAANPLGKIPALVLDDGRALFDSRVICEYLDSLHSGAKMFPVSGEQRWVALRRQALADGILDAAVITRYETALRPEALRWGAWSSNQKLKISRATAELERDVEGFADSVDIGLVAVGCALGYLDFRYADDNWRDGCPNLATWYEAFARRPSMQATMPADLR